MLLPGMDGTGLLLNPFIEALGRRVDAQLFDYPTHVIQSYEEIISNVEAVLPSTGEDFAILAESFAGPIALWLAQKDIPGLRGLILVVNFRSNAAPSSSSADPRLAHGAPSGSTHSLCFRTAPDARHQAPVGNSG